MKVKESRHLFHTERNHEVSDAWIVIFGGISIHPRVVNRGLNFSGASLETLSECPDPDTAGRSVPALQRPT